VDRSVVVDFKYAFFTRSQAGIYKQAMMKGAAAMIKKKEFKEAIQIAAWDLCAWAAQMEMKVLSRLRSPRGARVLGAGQGLTSC